MAVIGCNGGNNRMDRNFLKEYIINVDLETMQYKTISENEDNNYFNIPLAGKYQEFIHRIAMNFVHPDDLGKFLDEFFPENLKRSMENNVNVLGDEVRLIYNNDVYWKNINSVIYQDKNNRKYYAVISFSDITEKKIIKTENERLLYETASQVYNFVFAVNLTQNNYSVIMKNSSFLNGISSKGSFSSFVSLLASRITSVNKNDFLKQCRAENIISEFKNGRSEIIFKIRIQNDMKKDEWILMTITEAAVSETEVNAVVLCRCIDLKKNQTVRKADISVNDITAGFISNCFNLVYSENNISVCVNNLLKELTEISGAEYASLFFQNHENSVSAERIAYYSPSGKIIPGNDVVSGYEYKCELKNITDEAEFSEVMFTDTENMSEKYPLVKKHMQKNNIKNSAAAGVSSGYQQKGFISVGNITKNHSEISSIMKISALFAGFMLDRKFLINAGDNRRNHNIFLELAYNKTHNGIIQFEYMKNEKAVHLIDCNEAFCRIVDCPVDVVKRYFSYNFFKFVVDEDRIKTFNAAHAIISNEKRNSSTEVRILNKDGDIRWVHINMFRIEDEQSGRFIIQAEFTDITELKQEQLEKGIVYDAMPGFSIKCVFKNSFLEFLSANEKFYEFLGISDGENIPYIFSDSNFTKYTASHTNDFINRKSFYDSFMITLADGRKKWITVSAKCIGTNYGYPLYMLVIIDITEREEAYINLEKANMELKIRAERYSLIEKSTEEKIIEYDVKSDSLIIQESSEVDIAGSARKIENYLGNDFNGNFKSIICPDDYDCYIKIMEKALEVPSKGSADYRTNLHDNSSYKWYRSYYTSVADKSGKVVRLIARIKNIENERNRQKKLELQIKSDPMTGLLNKIAVKSEISDVLLDMPPLYYHAMMMIDIDNFKSVNDNLGHMFGDAVLKNIASAIRRTFRSSDIIGRIGGDEFIVFMKNTSIENAEMKARELCTSIKRTYSGNGRTVEISCSIGISYSKDNEDYDTLFEKADTAMYCSKKNGRNGYTSYSEDMQKSEHELTREDCGAVHASNKSFDMEIISFALSLMSNSKDIDSSINILLEQTGNRFDMTDIVLFECDECGELFPSNSWPERENSEIISSMNQRNYNMMEFDSRGVFCVENCHDSDSFVSEKTLFLDYKCFKSLIAVKSEDNAVLKVLLLFGDRKNVRKWNDIQKNTFYELSRIISVFTTLRDERRKDKEKIALLKTTDALTELYNFEAFKIKAEELIVKNKKSRTFALFYMDINGFTYVNDNFGYNAGDRMLCDFAVCVKDTIKDAGMGCACRVYSDYFLMLLSGESRSDVMLKIKSSNDRFFDMERRAYPAGSIGLSTGIYFISDDFSDITISIDNADLARKKAKRTNQNTYEIYTADLRLSRSNELSIIGELYRAMEKGKIELFLQPKFSLDTRQVIGAEALARWRNDDCSLKYPSEFVPALEKIGYIVKLDFYMYEQVLKCMRKWIDRGIKPIPISVNFSRKNSLEDGFYERVYNLAEAYGIDNSLVEIETTESTFINDINKMLETMRRFRNAGFKVDIDDFGTGYSSLNMLVSAPVDIVKIDKSFLKNIKDSQYERDYVKQMCKMISTANKDIIFEGVETEEQAQFLLECGFTMAQGYLFEKPIPLDEFENKYIFR